MKIETEHQGFKITFDEDRDVWLCWDLRFESPSLSKLKGKISQHSKDIRRVDRVKAYRLDHYDTSTEEVIVTLIDMDGEIWIATTGRRGSGRQKVKPELLVPDTPEALALVEVWRDAVAKEKEAEAVTAAAKAAIPRITVKMLDELRVAKAEGNL